MNTFSCLSEVYDCFNDGAGYEIYLEYILSEFQKHAKVPDEYQPRAVDLGCGTGEMSLALASRGFDVIGVDYSSEMLTKAMTKSSEHPELALFFVRQDMRRLHMDAKANLFISCFDCLNYLDNQEDLEATITGISNHCAPGGLLVFDVNTKYRFESYYGNNTFVFKKKDRVLLWENRYNKDKCQSYFDIEIFQREGTLYRRSREKHKQTWFSRQVIEEALNEAGFTLADRCTDRELWGRKEEALKTIYVAKKIN